jgi:uncharacterized protein (DUF58 family)
VRALQTSPLGTGFLIVCVAFALAGFLFMSLTWMVLCAALATVFIYARSRFVWELSRSNIRITHKVLDEMAFADEPVSVSVEIVNGDPATLHAVLEAVLPESATLGSGRNKVTATVPARSVASFTYSFVPRKRGVHAVGAVSIQRTDALGIFTHAEVVGENKPLSVHTRRDSFDTAKKTAGREHFEYAGMSRTPAVVLREFEFDGLREHVPGDRSRDIHWKSLSKTGKLMTKTYKKEGTLKTMIFVDCSRSMRLNDGGMAKIDHAVDLTLQLSNVLLSSYHPAGVALYDELTVSGEVEPSLGRHQFEKIIRSLRKMPDAVATGHPTTSAETSVAPAPSVSAKANSSDEGDAFLKAVKAMKGSKKKGTMGLEDAVQHVITHSRGQELLFIVVSDLWSSRNAVLASAKICKRTGNRLLVIQTYTDWYASPRSALDASEGEKLYGSIGEGIKAEAMLRGSGASFIRIGPADTTARIVRTIRRGVM